MTRGALAALLVAGLLIVRGFAIQPAVTQAPPADREAAYRANNVGIGYLEQFDYDKAVESFRRALAIDSSLDIARLNLAIALFYANNPDGALQEGRLAAERMPESPARALSARPAGAGAEPHERRHRRVPASARERCG